MTQGTVMKPTGQEQIIGVPAIVACCTEKWTNLPLTRVNDAVVRLGVIEGEYHWHRHEQEEEFFFVLEGVLWLDFEGRSVELGPQHEYTVPRGVVHRTRAPGRTVILMVEPATVTPAGD